MSPLLPDSATPRAAGYRWPAEWEPHAATWLSWPHNPETWPGRLPAVESAFLQMVEALAPHERVEINLNGAAEAERLGRILDERDRGLAGRVGFHLIATDDAWVRDHGPLFVVRDGAARDAGDDEERGRVAVVDFEFDAWGGKYPPWSRDAGVAGAVARELGVPCFAAEAVLEPGAIDGNGQGVVLTTESCLLHPNRGGGRARSREVLEKLLGDMLGADRVVWLADGIAGDDTDGHIDDITRFVASDVVVTAIEADEAHPNHAPLTENRARLHALRASDWPALEIVELPMPADHFAGRAPLPASHANFYVANGVVLMPVFGGESDARAASILAECFSGREIVGIPSGELVVGLGAVHCLTQQQPQPPPAPAVSEEWPPGPAARTEC